MAGNYCVMNVKKNKNAAVKKLQMEANRELKNYKNDVVPDRSNLNKFFVKCDDWNKKINEVLESEGIEKKENSVVLLTSVYAYSPEWGEGKSREEILSYFEKCVAFEQRKGVVISAVVHFDETTPHLHCATIPIADVPDQIAVPVVKKDEDGNALMDETGSPIYERYEKGKSKGKIKYKRINKTDENGNVQTHRGLNAKYIIGNKVRMSRMQTEFWETCGKPCGLSRGEIRVEDGEESRKRLDEADYKAKRIVERAKEQAEDAQFYQYQQEFVLQEREETVDFLFDAVRRSQADLKAREDNLTEKEEKVRKSQNMLSEGQRVLQEQKDEFTREMAKGRLLLNCERQEVREAKVKAQEAENQYKTMVEGMRQDKEEFQKQKDDIDAFMERMVDAYHALCDCKWETPNDIALEVMGQVRFKSGKTVLDMYNAEVEKRVVPKVNREEAAKQTFGDLYREYTEKHEQWNGMGL